MAYVIPPIHSHGAAAYSTRDTKTLRDRRHEAWRPRARGANPGSTNMATRDRQPPTQAHGISGLPPRCALAGALALGLALLPGASPAQAQAGRGRACSATAVVQLEACRREASDDLLTAKAVCIQVLDREERRECLAEARAEAKEAGALCREQRAARLDLCDQLGEDRYDPDFDPDLFDDDFTNPPHLNPYFPVEVDNRWEYVGGEETIVVEVLDQTKSIEGVTCVVVSDRVEEDGQVIEDTDDWYGQRTDGTVDYCGEISQNFEIFEGDDPEEPELVDVEGSWKAGRDGSLAGTRFPGAPAVGDVYRQEWSPGNAEDAAQVLSTTYGFGSDPELDEFVPQELAELLCEDDDCVVTLDFSPLEPDAVERKYHARGIGTFLEVHPDSGEVVQLVDCNFDARCDDLPNP